MSGQKIIDGLNDAIAIVRGTAAAGEKSTVLVLHIECGITGLYFVTSPMVRGLLIADPTFEGALQQVPSALADLARATPPARAD
jgi:hypothetical protein